jgi:O-antigen/teichoic acid export membrane protein
LAGNFYRFFIQLEKYCNIQHGLALWCIGLISYFAIFSQRFWQALSGLLSILFITHYLSPELQGWYYSFISIAALYTLFDLGLSVVLVQTSAHLFVKLHWLSSGKLSGDDQGRFRELVSWSTRHYVLLAGIYFILVMPGGILFFNHHPKLVGQEIHWLAPWVFLASIMAFSILQVPFLALVEGSGRVNEVYRIRLIQGVLGSLGCWTVLVVGGKLWAAVMAPGIGIMVVAAWLARQYPSLLADAFAKKNNDYHWGEAVWPLQWRVGLSWLSGYLLTQIYTPVLFYYQGAIVAGQMGLTLTIANMLGLLAQSWIVRHVPAMAQAVAKRDWQEFDRMFSRDFAVSTTAYLSGAAILCLIHRCISYTVYSQRVLSLWPFVGLMAVVLVNHITGALATQLRSYKQEPLVWVAVAGSLLTVPCALWAASVYSAAGVVAAILAVQLFLILPLSVWLWKKCNKIWRVGNI